MSEGWERTEESNLEWINEEVKGEKWLKWVVESRLKVWRKIGLGGDGHWMIWKQRRRNIVVWVSYVAQQHVRRTNKRSNSTTACRFTQNQTTNTQMIETPHRWQLSMTQTTCSLFHTHKWPVIPFSFIPILIITILQFQLNQLTLISPKLH